MGITSSLRWHRTVVEPYCVGKKLCVTHKRSKRSCGTVRNKTILGDFCYFGLCVRKQFMLQSNQHTITKSRFVTHNPNLCGTHKIFPLHRSNSKKGKTCQFFFCHASQSVQNIFCKKRRFLNISILVKSAVPP